MIMTFRLGDDFAVGDYRSDLDSVIFEKGRFASTVKLQSLIDAGWRLYQPIVPYIA